MLTGIRKILLAGMVLSLLATVQAADSGHAAAPKSDPEALWNDLAAGNKRFMSGQMQPREVVNTRTELAKGQHPKVIILTCADSRLSPELVFDKNLGDLFVVRTAGNIADKVALGSMEYAAEHLHCELIVVLGHEKCGAVAAAASGEKMPTKNLKAIVEMIEPALKEPRKQGLEKDALTALGVERNASFSAAHLVKESPILKEKLEAGELKIISAVYSLGSGEVKRQPEATTETKK